MAFVGQSTLPVEDTPVDMRSQSFHDVGLGQLPKPTNFVSTIEPGPFTKFITSLSTPVLLLGVGALAWIIWKYKMIG